MSLTESTRTYYYLKYYARHIGEFCEEKQFLPLDICENLRNLLKNVTIVLTQFKIILNTCPQEEVFGTEPSELPMTEPVTFKHSEQWVKSTNLINGILSMVKKLNTLLLKGKSLIPCTEFDIVVPQFVHIQDLSSLKSDLSNIQVDIKSLHHVLCENVATKSLIWIESEIQKILFQLDEDNSSENALSVEEFSKKVEKLTENILVVIQNLYKKYTTPPEPTENKVSEETEEQLQEEHLKKLVVESLSDDMAILDMKKILRKTHKIASVLLTTTPKLPIKDIAYQCIPFLEQIIYLNQYFITQQVSAYRVTSKMTSILLNIFIDLASKVSIVQVLLRILFQPLYWDKDVFLRTPRAYLLLFLILDPASGLPSKTF